MDWYAIQVLTGKEAPVVADLKDHGREVMHQRPLFYRRGGRFKVVQKPLMPGYVFASLKVEDFYIEKRDLRVEGMMIRLCGNDYEAVRLSREETEFVRQCNRGMWPLELDNLYDTYFQIVNPPSWAVHARIDWYAGDKFKAKFTANIKGGLKDHSFTVAAFTSRYRGRYKEQLQGLLEDGFVKRDAAYEQIVTQES
jgi:hypothetical protein